MNGVNVVIIHKKFDKQLVLSNVFHIPRVGERIAVWMAPAPIVKEVVWDEKLENVFIEVD